MRKFHGEKIRRRAASIEQTLLRTSFTSTMHMVHGWTPSWLGGHYGFLKPNHIEDALNPLCNLDRQTLDPL